MQRRRPLMSDTIRIDAVRRLCVDLVRSAVGPAAKRNKPTAAASATPEAVLLCPDSDSEKETDETAENERAVLSTFAEFLRNGTHHHQQQLTPHHHR